MFDPSPHGHPCRDIPAIAVIVLRTATSAWRWPTADPRGLAVSQIEHLPEVLPTVEPASSRPRARELAAAASGAERAPAVKSVARLTTVPWDASGRGRPCARLSRFTQARGPGCWSWSASGPTPSWRRAGRHALREGAIAVERGMADQASGRLNARGTAWVTYHRLLGETYLPLGNTAHKQAASPGRTPAAATGIRRQTPPPPPPPPPPPASHPGR